MTGQNVSTFDIAEHSKKHLFLLCFFASLLAVVFVIFFIIRSDAGDKARWPLQGDYIVQDGKLVADITYISEGYFHARVSSETSQRLKLRVVTGDTTLDYDLPGDCEYIVVPLQMGSGEYQVLLYENTSGKKYAQTGALYFYAGLSSENVSFLYPNQYVDYMPESAAVLQADILGEGKDDRAIFDSVCEFIKSDFLYDYVKAVTVQPGTLPDIDGSYEKKMGICQDLSAIMCCMLRTQGIPARLIIGYADDAYHAWVITELGDEEIFYDPTAEIGALKGVKYYSIERYY